MALADTGGGDVASAVMPEPDDVVLDFDIDDLQVQGLGFDLATAAAAADEFCDAYSEFLAAANANRGDKKKSGSGWMAGGVCGSDGGGGSSPEDTRSAVTDGPGMQLPAAAGDDDDDEAMSAYVSELERFLLMDDDDDDDGLGACEQQVEKDLVRVRDYFGNLLLAGGDGEKNGGGEGNGDVLAAREDEPASRKRARNKIKGTSLMPWGELEVTRVHLARIQPCHHHQRLLCCI